MTGTMANLHWLKVGLGIKRWVVLICGGMMLLVVGAILLGLGLFNLHTPESLPVSPYGLGGLFCVIGGALVFSGVYRLVRRIEKVLKNKDEPRGLTELAYLHSRLNDGPRVVCMGGGTGMNCLLSGLRDFSSDITAVVSVADDGGSSGRLRSNFGLLPPGDIRNCLSALADAGPVMTDLMQYRFEEGEFEGHSFGNLFIMVLTKIRGSFGLAVREANRILKVRGQVLPATLDHVTLVATHDDGTKTTGQKNIAQCGKRIEELALKPTPGATPPDVLEKIAGADLIVIGPGSLFTSIMPNLLAEDVVKAIAASQARVMFVVNTMEQSGETHGFRVSDYIGTLQRLAPGLRVDVALVNNYRPSPALLEPLLEQGVRMTEYDPEDVAKLGIAVRLRDVIRYDNPEKHDPRKLAIALLEDWSSASK